MFIGQRKKKTTSAPLSSFISSFDRVGTGRKHGAATSPSTLESILTERGEVEGPRAPGWLRPRRPRG